MRDYLSLTKVKDILHLVCLITMVYILIVIAAHVAGWAKIVDKTLLHIDAFAGEGKIAMKNLAESSIASRDSANLISRRLPLLIDQVHGTITKANSVLDSTEVAMVSANRTINAATDTLLATTSTVSAFDVRMADTLASLHPVMEAGQQTFISVQRFLDGPATRVADSADGVLKPTGLFMTDIQRKEHELLFPPPYTGKHPVWHKTKQFLWYIPRHAQNTYYGIRIFKGD